MLGSGPTLTNVVLAIGTHTLTYSATNSAGKTGSASVTVEVRALTTVDLTLAADALVVTVPGRDPSDQTTPRMQVGEPSVLLLRTRNQGTTTTAKLSLYGRAPGGTEVLLVERTLTLAPFAVGSVSSAYTPTSAGSFTFRGVVQAISPTDPTPANNTRTWTVAAATPPQLGPTAAGLNLGPAQLQRVTTKPFVLASTGGFDLRVYSVTIEGTYAGDFRLTLDQCTARVIAAGQSCELTVGTTPHALGTTSATLVIMTNDPAQGRREVALTATGISYQQVKVLLSAVYRKQ